MRNTLTVLFLLFFLSLMGQSLDLTGTWVGSSSFLNRNYELEYEITQQGKKVVAIVLSRSNKDSVKARLEGFIKGNQLELEAKSLIFKTGLACMADATLKYTLTGNQKTLVGRWKGTAKFNTCPYLASGSVMLLKEQSIDSENPTIDRVATAGNSSEEESVERNEGVALIREEDNVGQALVRELSNRKYYALIVGVNHYRDDDIQDLDNPINDAKNLAGVLVDHYSFNQEEVSVLQNPSREDIIDALDELSVTVTEKDNLLIFFAGHGIWNAQLNQGYWLPSDASLDSKSKWLSNSTLRDYVGGIRSKHTLLISDACFSGGILKERAVFDNSRAILEVYKLPSRKAMTSGTLKTVPDKSVFIQYLLKNLINNQEPLLSADHLFRNFKTAVINNSPNGQVPQYGPISQAGDEGGDFIFLRKQ